MENTKTLKFTLRQTAKYLNVTSRTVAYWCNSGSLPHKRDGAAYVITKKALVDFLYFNPKYRRNLEQRQFSGLMKAIQQEMLLEIYAKRPILYSTEELTDIFDVDRSTVRAWHRNKGLPIVQDKRAMNINLFRKEDVEAFLTSEPYYQSKYYLYFQEQERKDRVS